MINSKNKDYWNIVKGIGIFSIVLGHSCYFSMPYVYLYHLVIFFFVSGYLYSEDKYGDDPFANFLARFKTNFKKYFAFSSLFVLFHNVFYEMGIIINTTNYSLKNIIIQIIYSMIFQCSEVLSGALWFVPIIIISSSIFGSIIYYGRKLDNIFNNKFLKNSVIISASILFAILGVKLNMQNTNITYHLQTVFLVIPIFVLAYYVRKIKDINPYLKWYIFIPSIVFLWLCVNKFSWNVELSNNQIPNYMFYIVSIVGIYACLYLSKVILKLKYIKKYFELIGTYSFEIMALHFLSLKIVDLIYALIINESNKSIYGVFPYAYSDLWLIYAIVGTLLPCLIMIIYNKCFKVIINKFKIS